MKRYRITAPENRVLDGEVNLPASKSISNRYLIIRALADAEDVPIIGLSDATDTKNLIRILKDEDAKEINVGLGGTTYRFLLAYYAIQSGRKVILNAEEGMRKRPIGLLVQALKDMGAEIEYLGELGHPPVQIKGANLKGGHIKISGEVSSQYLSAIAMIAPYTQDGVELEISGNAVSRHYFEMTLKIMQKLGIQVDDQGNVVKIRPGDYDFPNNIEIEADWSSASYWYSFAALARQCTLKLKYLSNSKLQPDSATCRIFNGFGVGSIFKEDETWVVKEGEPRPIQLRRYDLIYSPDIAQTMAVVIAALNKSAIIEGLQTLKIKETDRLTALQKELSKINADVEIIRDQKLVIDGDEDIPEEVEIATYNDHRMAMAFAPLALRMKSVIIQDPDVVSKSYPDFWDEMKEIGFTIEEV